MSASAAFTSTRSSTPCILPGGASVPLTTIEFKLLHCLMRNAGRVVTATYLLNSAWGYDYEGESNQIAVYVRRLRNKIEKEPNDPRYIVTVRRLGYRLRKSEAGYKIQDARCKIQDTGCGMRDAGLDTRNEMSSQTSGFVIPNLGSHIPYLVPCILHLVSCILRLHNRLIVEILNVAALHFGTVVSPMGQPRLHNLFLALPLPGQFAHDGPRSPR